MKSTEMYALLDSMTVLLQSGELDDYNGRKITASLGYVTVRGEKKMERARGKHDGEESV
jgi:hypothetical protein